MPSAILSVAYLPPVQYMTKFLVYDQVCIEMHENYQKQSFRNRCIIFGANGPLTMVIPVKKNHGEKTVISDIQLDFDTSWQKIHWKSMVSAYRNSPFFEFYQDELYRLLMKHIKYLADYNLMLLDYLVDLIDPGISYKTSTHYLINGSYDDYRLSVNPKKRLQKPDVIFEAVPYKQVFSEQHGFIPNLSIVDLIFNMGPESYEILSRSIKKGIK